MQSHAENSACHGQISDPLRRSFPQAHHQRNLGIFGQSAVGFRIRRIVQHVDHSSAANALRIVDSSVVESEMFLKLFGARLSNAEHVFLCPEVQAPCRTGLYTCRLQSLADAIGAERALEHLLRAGIEFRNVEGTSAHAVAAADTVLLLKIN